MGAKYLVDLNKENNDGGFILNLGKVKDKSYVHISMDFLINEVKLALESKKFNRAYAYIEEAHNININSDSVFFLELITKAYEAIYDFDNLEDNDILGHLEMKKKLIKAARFGRSSATAILLPEHKDLLTEVDNLEESIDENLLLEKLGGALSEEDIDFRTLKVLESHSYNNPLAKELVEECKKILNNKIKDKDVVKLFVGLYPKEFFSSEELNNSLNIEFENYEQLLKRVENCYSLYRFNREKNMDNKISILTNGYFVKSFIGKPKLHKIYMIKKLSSKKDVLVNLDKFIEEGEKILLNLFVNERKEKAIPFI